MGVNPAEATGGVMDAKDDKRAGRQALGRGLGALLPSVGDRRGLLVLGIEQISPDRTQPRHRFDETLLKELADSIKTHGILQPLLVRRIDSGYRLIAGERRWRAAQLAGLREVPAIVRESSERVAFELALLENIQRADLNPVEEAEAYRRLIDDHGLTQDQLATRLGKDRSTVTNALRLLRLPAEVKSQLLDGALTMGHARALLAIGDDGELRRAALSVVRDGLSVRATESLAQRTKVRRDDDAPAKKKPSPHARQLTEQLQRALGTAVGLKETGKGTGRLEISYSSYEQLEQLVERIGSRRG